MRKVIFESEIRYVRPKNLITQIHKKFTVLREKWRHVSNLLEIV